MTVAAAWFEQLCSFYLNFKACITEVCWCDGVATRKKVTAVKSLERTVARDAL